MTSLRARIAALLITAIVSVVALATLAASTALGPPPPAAIMEPLARQLQLVAALAETNPVALTQQGGVILSAPAAGLRDEAATSYLISALAGLDPEREAVISRREGDAALTASVRLRDGNWLVSPLPNMKPPPGQWRILALWISLIAIGAGAVSLYAAWMVTRPLQLLEDAVERIGPDGVLAPVPERGSGEIRATARALNRLSEQLKSAMESRMRLIAAAGHDLRTPMTRMRLRAEFITDETERVKWLADLEELDTIADSAISLVREEASHETAEPVRLDRLLGEIAQALEPMKYPLRLDQLEPLAVRAGPRALKRALQNLIINAATHGGGAHVALRREAGAAVVVITDDGPGIPEDVLGRVFEPFFRVDPARRKLMPGAGLGMAIAREIVERFGGSVHIHNRRPHGLEQRVTLALGHA